MTFFRFIFSIHFGTSFFPNLTPQSSPKAPHKLPQVQFGCHLDSILARFSSYFGGPSKSENCAPVEARASFSRSRALQQRTFSGLPSGTRPRAPPSLSFLVHRAPKEHEITKISQHGLPNGVLWGGPRSHFFALFEPRGTPGDPQGPQRSPRSSKEASKGQF